jgi:hypothetical protein
VCFTTCFGQLCHVPATHTAYRILWTKLLKLKRYSSPVAGLEWPREFQEVKVPRLHYNGTGWW